MIQHPILPVIVLCTVFLASLPAEPVPAPGTPGPEPGPGYAELPHWPLGVRLPDAFVSRKPDRRPPRADVLLWAPPVPVRAVLLVPENTDSKHFAEHATLRAAATRQGLAIVYLRGVVRTGVEDQPLPSDPTLLPALLGHLADTIKIGELRNAPWIAFGKSSRGRFPHRVAWLFPERTVATVTYHGETPPFPVPDYAKTGRIPHVNVNGENEWDGTWFRHVRPALLNYRIQAGWPAHQVVVKDVGHGNYPDAHGSPGWGQPFPERVTCIDVWNYLALFIEHVLELRLPPDPPPSGIQPELRPIAEESGWLLAPCAPEILFKQTARPLVRKADGYYEVDPSPSSIAAQPVPRDIDQPPILQPARDVPPALRPGYFWLPDEDLARAWLALHTPSPATSTIPPLPPKSRDQEPPAPRP